jgi:hypothetical protein
MSVTVAVSCRCQDDRGTVNGTGSTVMEWEYLLFTARQRA